jgi:hypothetical protein
VTPGVFNLGADTAGGVFVETLTGDTVGDAIAGAKWRGTTYVELGGETKELIISESAINLRAQQAVALINAGFGNVAGGVGGGVKRRGSRIASIYFGVSDEKRAISIVWIIPVLQGIFNWGGIFAYTLMLVNRLD